jgi:peptide/nickel transport system substrate-binding protein
MKKLTISITLFICLSFLLTACGPSTATPAVSASTAAETPSTPAQAPSLVMAADISAVITSDPVVMCEQITTMLFSLTYESLVMLDPANYGNVIPALAQSWELSADQKTYTFHLNPNAKFASGNPVTADDVKFSFDRNRKDPATCIGSYLAPVESVTVVDAQTVQIATKQPDAAFLTLLSCAGFAILEKAVVVAHGGTDTADTADTAKDWLDHNSAGSGPYILTKWEPNAEMDYDANPNWWQGTPPLSRFIVKHVEDPTLAVQMLQTGEADLVPWLDFDLIDTVKADPNLVITSHDDITTTYMGMNLDPAISEYSANELVRQAIAAAINKDEIIQTILHGFASRAPNIISVGELGVNTADNKPRDLTLARSLLAQAGYQNGITIQLSYYASPPEWGSIATVIQANLAEIGITVTLNPLETSVFLTQVRASQLPFAILSWGPDTPDPTQLTDIFCYDAVVGKRFNAVMPEATPLCDQLHTEFDTTKRAELVQQITGVFNDYMVYTQLFNKQFVAASTNAVSVSYIPGRFLDLSKTTKH